MRGWLAIALTLIAVPVSAATTTKFALSTPVWTDLGAGPMIVSSSGLTVFAIGDTTPTIPAYEGGTLPKGDSMDFSTKSHVWVMPAGTSGVSVYAAPAVFGPGGGTAPTSVWSAADAAANGMTLSNGGLTVTVPANYPAFAVLRNSASHNSGKLYAEFRLNSGINQYTQIGVASAGVDINNYLGNSNYSFGTNTLLGNTFGSVGFSGVSVSTFAGALAVNDVMHIAVDFGAGKIWIGFNNAWSDSGVPSSGTNPTMSFVPATVGPLFVSLAFSALTSPQAWTLQPTAASQTYAPPAGFTAWDGGAAPTGCAEATAYLARATGETAHAADLTTLICGLVTDGVWSKLDALYVLAQQTQADAKLNLVSASYPLTGTATFAAYQGFSAFPNPAFDTGFNPGATGHHFIQDSASISAWEYDPSIVNAQMRTSGALGGSYIFATHTGLWFCGLSIVVVPPGFTWTAVAGLYACDRSNSAGEDYFYNGVNKNNDAIPTTTTDTTANMFVGSGSDGYNITTTLSAAHIGASLGSAGQTALYNRLQAYMTAVQGCPEATAYLARATGETAHPADLTTLICGLVSDGVWSKLDALYVLAQQTQADAKLNLIGTSYSPLTGATTATFTAYKGFSAFSGADGLNTGFDPATAPSPHFTGANANLGVWAYDAPDGGIYLAAGTSTGCSAIAPSYTGTQYYAYISYAAANFLSPPNTAGWYSADKPTSSGSNIYYNAGLIGNDASGVAGPAAYDMLIGTALDLPTPVSKTISAATFGASLGGAGQTALYNRLRTYMTAVGVP